MKRGIIILAAIILSGLLLYSWQNRKESGFRIALCPTFFEIAEVIEGSGFEVIKTGSTSESLHLLGQGLVDLVLSGRKLMPLEPGFEFRKIGNGYSFLGSKEMFVLENNAADHVFHTDLEKEKVEKDFPFISSLEEVEDIYDRLGAGILITSWDNTDYGKAFPVHLIKEDGSRNKLSRTPVLYCSGVCEEKTTDKIKEMVALYY